MVFQLIKYKVINICKTIKLTRTGKKTSGYVFLYSFLTVLQLFKIYFN